MKSNLPYIYASSVARVEVVEMLTDDLNRSDDRYVYVVPKPAVVRILRRLEEGHDGSIGRKTDAWRQ